MKGDLCFSDRSRISQEILAYLSEHPDAEDTVDGIVQWWLLERKIKNQTVQVREVLAELVRQGLLIESIGSGSLVLYRLSAKKQGAGET